MAVDARVAGLLAGYAADLAFGDPRRGHPVAGFGSLARRLERAGWADSKARGACYTGVLVGAVGAGAWVVERPLRDKPLIQASAVAAATWLALGGRSLRREGTAMGRLLADGDLARGRARLSHLCARDASALDLRELARASVESIAENTSDAVVAPLVCGAVGGLPGLLAYRAANTLDAMVGYRSLRYRRFGWAAARLDDLANLLPSRVTAVLTAACAGTVGGRPSAALRVWRDDAHRHPSPNAGAVEAAFAGALGVRLGGVNRYHGDAEDRGTLGDGRPVEVADLPQAVRLSAAVSLAAAVVAAALAEAVTRPRRAGRRG